MPTERDTDVPLRDYLERMMAYQCEIIAVQTKGQEKALDLAAENLKAQIIEYNSKIFATSADLRDLCADVRIIQLWKENISGRWTMLGILWGAFVFFGSIAASILIKVLLK